MGDDIPSSNLVIFDVQPKKSCPIKSFVAIPQVKVNVALPLGIPKSVFYRALLILQRSKKMKAPSQLLQDLKSMGVVSPNTPHCDVMSTQSTSKVLKHLKAPMCVHQSIEVQVHRPHTLTPSPSHAPSHNKSQGPSHTQGMHSRVHGDDEHCGGSILRAMASKETPPRKRKRRAMV